MRTGAATAGTKDLLKENTESYGSLNHGARRQTGSVCFATMKTGRPRKRAGCRRLLVRSAVVLGHLQAVGTGTGRQAPAMSGERLTGVSTDESHWPGGVSPLRSALTDECRREQLGDAVRCVATEQGGRELVLPSDLYRDCRTCSEVKRMAVPVVALLQRTRISRPG